MEQIELRRARAEDEPFLFVAFCAAREAEFAPLPPAQREQLLRLQYEAQTRDYAGRYPRLEDCVIECCGQPAGRLLLNRESAELRVVDITVLPEYQRRGIASAVLKSLICEARSAGIALRLSVWHGNPAASLYRRLGAQVREESATHLELEWRFTSPD